MNTRRARFASVVVLGLLVLAGCSSSGDRVSTDGVTEVRISSYQALPPPYKPPHVTLSSDADLNRFKAVMDEHAIAMVKKTEGGCGGGVTYTIELAHIEGGTTTLTISACAGKYYGNVGGKDLEGFVNDLQKMLG